MNARVEVWVLVVMLLAGSVLVIGEAMDENWLGTGLWVLAVAVVAAVLVRRRSKSSPE